jgi:signal transduction histidine kinase/CheY-like chemotaxis protein
MNDQLANNPQTSNSTQKDTLFSIIKNFQKNSSQFQNLAFYFQGIVECNINKSSEIFYFKLFLRKVEIGESSWVEIMMYDISSTKKIEKVDQTIYLKEKILSKIAHEFKTPLICVIALAEEIYNYLKENITMEEYKVIKKKIRHVRDLSNYTLYLISDITQGLNSSSPKEENQLSEEKDPQKRGSSNDREYKSSGAENSPVLNSFIKYSNKKVGAQVIVNMEKVYLYDIFKFCYRILKTLLIYNKNKISFIKPKREFDKQLKNVKIKTDPLRLKQILLNLVSNSVKFTQSGSITLVAKKDDKFSCLKLGVQDTGVGIKSEDLHKVFKDFNMLDEHMNMNFFGTGLGLSISLNLAELLGYQLRVHSQPGQGSFFYLNIGYEFLRNADFKIIKKSKSQYKLEFPKGSKSNSTMLNMSVFSNVYFNDDKENQENKFLNNSDRNLFKTFSFINSQEMNTNQNNLALLNNIKKKYDTSKTFKLRNKHFNVDEFEKYKKKNEREREATPQVPFSFTNSTKNLIYTNVDNSKKIIRNPNFSLFQKQEDIPNNLFLEDNKEWAGDYTRNSGKSVNVGIAEDSQTNPENHHITPKSLKNDSKLSTMEDLRKKDSASSIDSGKTLKKTTNFNYDNLKRLKSQFRNEDSRMTSNRNVLNTNYINKEDDSKVEINNNFIVKQKNLGSGFNSRSSSEDNDSLSYSSNLNSGMEIKIDTNNVLVNKPKSKKSNKSIPKNQSITLENQIGHSLNLSDLMSNTISQVQSQNPSQTNLNTISLQGHSAKSNKSHGQIQPPSQIQSQLNVPTYKILIIDDNMLILNFLENLLLKILKENNVINYKIIRGMDGVDLIKNVIDDQKNGNLIKIVFIDENMEFMNGSESIQIVRKLEASNKIKSVQIVRFTADDNQIQPTGLQNSSDTNTFHTEIYLNKPPKKKEVINLLKLFKIIL